MTFAAFLHRLTTSRYTRLLERENAELREQVGALKLEHAKAQRELLRARLAQPDAMPDEEASELRATIPPRRGRPGRFQSFGAAKRRLENQPEAPQRSVTS